jgi:hypothetical protein
MKPNPTEARLALLQYEAVKSGRKTLILFESIKRRLASLPRVEIKRKRRQRGGGA